MKRKVISGGGGGRLWDGEGVIEVQARSRVVAAIEELVAALLETA
jgi:hypothetical protein